MKRKPATSDVGRRLKCNSLIKLCPIGLTSARLCISITQTRRDSLVLNEWIINCENHETSSVEFQRGLQHNNLASVRLDWYTIVHFVNPHDLLVSAVSTKFVVFTHNEGFHRLGGTNFRTQSTERTPR